VQGVLELRQRLMTGGTELLRLDLGQGFELGGAGLAPNLGESFGRLGARLGWFSASGILRVDPLGALVESQAGPVINKDPLLALIEAQNALLRRVGVTGSSITRLAARADLDDGRGHAAYVAYENLLMEGSARSRQPIDLLFLIDRGFTSVTRVQQVTLGARWDFGPIAVRYDALISENVVTPGTAPVLVLAQHTIGVGIAPACDCWRLDLLATQRTFPTVLAPTVGFNVTISKFGSIGR
jgi:LPS-assembly protein